MESFFEQVKTRIKRIGSVLCVGLDTVEKQIPDMLRGEDNPQLAFNRAVIDATHGLACCYKTNMAFYLAAGVKGFDALKSTIGCAHSLGVPVILDAKWGDIGHTADYYAQTAFETLEADAVTVNPYMGEEAIAPFRNYSDRGVFVLCYTSNLSRIDLQTQMVSIPDSPLSPLYKIVARKIVEWNTAGNLGAVAGATAPEELARIREIVGPSLPILCPGIGAQGGDLEEVLWAGMAAEGTLYINVSRAIINASSGADFAQAAQREAKMFVDQMQMHFAQARAVKNSTVE
ncbi:MAG: orotidine-5'-phosphate decarboxylase [Candidatus Omnitrophota bacterium]